MRETHAKALFFEDRWNRALDCPESRAAEQPEDPSMLRCVYSPTAEIRVGADRLWVGVTRRSYEWDGMYGVDEDVVLLTPTRRGDLVVAHTLRQWSQDVVDFDSRILQRRWLTRDLDGDGETELCIESIEERGAGLFTVLGLWGDAPGPIGRWYPAERHRGLSAWRYRPQVPRLDLLSTLDGLCPRTGYQPFVNVDDEDPLRWRQGVQGEDRRGLARGRALERWELRRYREAPVEAR